MVLDGPETGRDFHNQMVVLILLQDLVREKNLIVVMNIHDPAHVIRIADKVILIDRSHLVGFGPVDECTTGRALGHLQCQPVDLQYRQVADVEGCGEDLADSVRA